MFSYSTNNSIVSKVHKYLSKYERIHPNKGCYSHRNLGFVANSGAYLLLDDFLSPAYPIPIFVHDKPALIG